MHTSRRFRRGFVLAAAAGLLALGAGGASAAGVPSGTGAATGAASGRGFDDAGSVPRGAAQHVLRSDGGTPEDGRTTGNGAIQGSGRAISHATQKTGAAVSQAPSPPAHQDLGAVSRVAAQAAPSSAPGLPEGLVIRIPELVPGVPDVGVIPASLPALPVTPGIPAP